MGRKRKFNPDIPGHIDQRALPAGVYWADGRWYILEDHPEGGRPRKRTVAYADARNSELHAKVEEAQGGVPRGSLGHLIDAFKKSTDYKRLQPGTKKDYDQQAATVRNWKLKDGSLLGEMPVRRFTVPIIQRLVEAIAAGREATPTQPAIPAAPSKANHVLRYLRRLFSWGVRFGFNEHNPGRGVRQAEERGDFRMPTHDAQDAVLAFARRQAALTAHTRGSVSPYMPAVMVVAYNVRLRGIEVTTLTDAHVGKEGITSNRTKGSLDNLTEWNDELRAAVNWLQAYRAERMKAHDRPVPIRAEDRQLLVSQEGTPLTKSALDSAWQRLIRMAIREKVIEETERFSLHGLKHRGITDSENEADGGHRTLAMRQRYNHRLAKVKPPSRP